MLCYTCQHSKSLQVLIWAQLRGNNQSVIKIPAGAVARSKDQGTPNVHSHGPVTLFDGQQQYGMVMLHQATEQAITSACAGGLGMAGTNNTSSSTGALG